MTYLLDVNVLISLIDPKHVLHDSAFDWFRTVRRGRWATCPITQNGFVRITSGAGYPVPLGTPAEVAVLLKDLLGQQGHEFWPDDVSLVSSELIDMTRIISHRQSTDTYLLALAASRGGKLATFDRRLSTAAVRGGAEALHIISDPHI